MLYQPFNPKATNSGEKWGTLRYVAYVLHHTGSPQWVDLGEAQAIDQAVTNFRTESVIVANPDYDKPGDPAFAIATNPETSPPAPLLQGEGSNIVPPFPRREGGLGGLGQSAPTHSIFDEDRTQQIEFSPLANTAAEAKAISPMLPGATLLTGSQATENAIQQLQAPKILRIATHGFFL
ncbi:MAG: CHAT domain-containing protein [Microcoleus sp. SIO2G3]|nr:CHAT domain-containing protein [Microcoleus sp. SIO2G3]